MAARHNSTKSIHERTDREAVYADLQARVDYAADVVASLELEGKDATAALLRLGLAKRKLEKARCL